MPHKHLKQTALGHTQSRKLFSHKSLHSNQLQYTSKGHSWVSRHARIWSFQTGCGVHATLV